MNRRWLLLMPALLSVVAVVASGSRWVATLAPADEPGTRLVVTGQVFDHTGTRPLSGVKLYAYHTDAKGSYGPAAPILPRLRGTLVTNGEGRFEWHTIRPMPYPEGRNPAHIHIRASGGGYPKQWVDELHFIDDPYLTASQREASRKKGKFASIVAPARDARGVLRATFNIRMSNNPSR